VLSACYNIDNWFDVVETEATATLLGIKNMPQSFDEHIILETDYKDVATAFSSDTNNQATWCTAGHEVTISLVHILS
jgi:hypothetical protein